MQRNFIYLHGALKLASTKFHRSNSQDVPGTKNVLINQKETVMQEIKYTIDSFKSSRAKLLKFSEDFQVLSQNILSSINSTLKLCKKLQKELLTGSIVSFPVLVNKKFHDKFLTKSKFRLLIKDRIKELELPNVKTKFSVFFNDFNEIFTSLTSSKPQNLTYFLKNSKNFINFNTNTYELTLKTLEHIEPQGKRSCISHVSPDKIFVYGGYTSNPLTTAYFISLSSYQIEHLPTFIPRYGTTPALVDEKVFVFGGYGLTNIQEAHYFNIRYKTWRSITSLTSPQTDISTLKINKEIIIAGSNKFLQSYDTETDKYKDLGSNINPGKYNVLLKCKRHIFLLAKIVFMAKKSEKKFFMMSLNGNIDISYVTCQPVINKNKAYFYDDDFKIYVFSLNDYTLRVIANGSLL